MTKKRAVLVIPLLVLVGALAVALAQRNRDGSDAADQSPSVAGGLAEPATSDSAPADTGGRPATVSRQAVATAPMSRAVISTGQVTLHAKALSRARAEVVRMVGAWGGIVADEQTTSDDKGRLSESTLTLRVPAARFDEAITAIGALGEVEHQSRSSEDVTTQVIDNDARVRAAERSIRQIEALLSRAEKLGDVIAIESELARRQADLDSLKQQQAWLSDQTSLSTITVDLIRPTTHPATRETKGFLAGLEGGWRALGSATAVALTAVGAVLPFAVLLAVIGAPLWVVVRRHRVARPSGA